jgi:2-phospho-L-lactate guanylyltransferase
VHPDDIDVVVGAAPAERAALLVPSHEGTGTNAMLLRPPQALAPCLGPESLARHVAQARERGVRSERLELPRVGLDIDRPRDLAILMGTGVPCATLEVCERLRVADLLEAGSAL